MLYHIKGYSPNLDADNGFTIQLWPAWKEAVAAYEPVITQDMVNECVKANAPIWLRGHGWKMLSESAHKDGGGIRVTWGEYGPEHIDVPGNACGLDIDNQSGFGRPMGGGAVLVPHNMDTVVQASLTLTIFLQFADIIVTGMELRKWKEREKKT